MEPNQVIAQNLNQLRTQQNLSIGQLAEKTGLSKAVLSQLEKGNSNPTINTIWKIAEALRVPYTSILEPQPVAARKLTRSELQVQTDESGEYHITCYFPTSPSRNYEWLLLEFEPGGTHIAEGHPSQSEEYIIVTEGILTIEVAGETFELHPEDALYFNANVKHVYKNKEMQPAKAFCINYYTRD